MRRIQKERAVLVGYAARYVKKCNCPACEVTKHVECWVQVRNTNGGYGCKHYLCEDWADKVVSKDSIVVLTDTGKRWGRRVVWRVV